MSALLLIGCPGDSESDGEGSTGDDTTATASSADTTSSTTDPPPTSGSDGSGSSSSSGPTFPPVDLRDDGLIARYFLAEAASGQDPTHARDAAEDPLDLSLSYAGDEDPAYVEQDGHRGLAWAAAGTEGVAFAPIAGTKVATALEGAESATLEAVFSLTASEPSASRIVHIGDNSGVVAINLASVDPNEVFVRVGENNVGRFDFDFAAAGRVVVHAIYDSAQETHEERVRVFVDGQEVTLTSGSAAGSLEPITVPGGSELALGNRGSGSFSFGGTLYYAAIYTGVLDADAIAQHVAELTAVDDA